MERCRIIETSISNCAGWLAGWLTDAYAHGSYDDGDDCGGGDSLSDSSSLLSLRGEEKIAGFAFASTAPLPSLLKSDSSRCTPR